LRALGVDARQAEAWGRSPAPSLAPCFDAPVAGELVAHGRKLVGSAQVRDGSAFLQHGSILVDDDQHLLTELLLRHETSAPPATLRALTGRSVTREEFSTALANAVAAHDEGPPRRFDLDGTVLDDVRTLVHTRFAVADWTWRR
jgi:lipoate-protein ligase A